MRYIYPKFSKTELPFVRFGGPGLGNLLFIYARAVVEAQKNNFKMIAPTWRSLKIGPWIRHEKDKRWYGDLFQSDKDDINGYRKLYLINCNKTIEVDDVGFDFSSICDGQVVLYSAFQMNFDGLVSYQELIKNKIISNLSPTSKKGLLGDMSHSVNVHVRLGDFSKNQSALDQGQNNYRIQIDWYVTIVKQLKDLIGDHIHFNIFSDGTDEELKDLLTIDNVSRCFSGNSMADIIALSRAPLIVASGSSFSMWARFLGQNSSISYPSQMKDKVLHTNSKEFEIETKNIIDLPMSIHEKIKSLY